MTKNEKLLNAVRIGKFGFECITSIGTGYVVSSILEKVMPENVKIFRYLCSMVAGAVMAEMAYEKEDEYIEKVFKPLEDYLEAKIKEEKSLEPEEEVVLE